MSIKEVDTDAGDANTETTRSEIGDRSDFADEDEEGEDHEADEEAWPSQAPAVDQTLDEEDQDSAEARFNYAEAPRFAPGNAVVPQVRLPSTRERALQAAKAHAEFAEKHAETAKNHAIAAGKEDKAATAVKDDSSDRTAEKRARHTRKHAKGAKKYAEAAKIDAEAAKKEARAVRKLLDERAAKGNPEAAAQEADADVATAQEEAEDTEAKEQLAKHAKEQYVDRAKEHAERAKEWADTAAMRANHAARTADAAETEAGWKNVVAEKLKLVLLKVFARNQMPVSHGEDHVESSSAIIPGSIPEHVDDSSTSSDSCRFDDADAVKLVKDIFSKLASASSRAKYNDDNCGDSLRGKFRDQVTEAKLREALVAVGSTSTTPPRYRGSCEKSWAALLGSEEMVGKIWEKMPFPTAEDPWSQRPGRC